MRELTEQEARIVFQKVALFVGENLKIMMQKQNGEEYVFRLHNKKIYYVNSNLLKRSSNFSRDHLVSFGVCLGKFTHGGKFHLMITALDYLTQYAKYKVWVKESSELSFLYGNHVLKTGVRKITQGTPKFQGVVVMSVKEVPLGFGITAKGIEETRLSKPTDVVVINQGDTGFYLRKEGVSAIFG